MSDTRRALAGIVASLDQAIATADDLLDEIVAHPERFMAYSDESMNRFMAELLSVRADLAEVRLDVVNAPEEGL